MQTNTHAVTVEQNAVRRGFEELERYLRSQGPAPRSRSERGYIVTTSVA
jgi:hypothetical protein